MSQKRRTALVTGFGGCIGSANAVSLAEAGFGVVGTDRSLSDSVKQSMEKIKKISGKDVLFFECDLLNRENIDHLFRTIASEVPSGIDILVNNAAKSFWFTPLPIYGERSGPKTLGWRRCYLAQEIIKWQRPDMFKPLGRKRRNRLKLKSNKTSLVNNGTAKTFREYLKAMTERCPMEEKTLESWDNEMALNLTAPFMLSKHFAGSMKKKGWGRIMIMSSVAGMLTFPCTIGYCTSKKALIGLTKAIAVELAPHGVTCNAICPYFVDTPFIQPFLDSLKEETGQSREETLIGDYVVFLCSPAADNMTGLTTPMDGGYSIV